MLRGCCVVEAPETGVEDLVPFDSRSAPCATWNVNVAHTSQNILGDRETEINSVVTTTHATEVPPFKLHKLKPTSMMVIDGVTWACETCIRGHRAASCNHIERPLKPLGKKGRPVSQCHHCRSLRSSRSLHTRCKCELVARNGASGGNEKRCRCMEGGACKCAYKKCHSTTSIAPGLQNEILEASESSSGSPSSLQESLSTGGTPLQPISHGDSPSEELGVIGGGVIDHMNNAHNADAWNPELVSELPRLPSAAVTVEGVNWDPGWEVYPNSLPPYLDFTETDTQNLELSNFLDAFVEESAMELGSVYPGSGPTVLDEFAFEPR
ncbi:hypothetical protein TWF481_003641 [Arthrobotrys musiformis]|uniref:Copper-fist domain-containing protein n=1 Tax=Arthrobotrys musiformis TaxID=47236 RepID=A0AAV9WIG9_9PEZI